MKQAKDVLSWQSAWAASMKPWVQFPSPTVGSWQETRQPQPARMQPTVVVCGGGWCHTVDGRKRRGGGET